MKLIDGPMQAMYVLSTSRQRGSSKNKKNCGSEARGGTELFVMKKWQLSTETLQ